MSADESPRAGARVAAGPLHELIRPDLTLTVQQCRGICVVTLRGRATRGTAAALRTGLIDAMGGGGPRLVLDLLAVHTCDEAGARVIEATAVRADRRGGWLRVAGAPAPVLATLSGFFRTQLTVYARVEDAISRREQPRLRAGRPAGFGTVRA